MRQPAMETTMEKIARIYTNKRDIVAVPGNGFATDGQKIYYVPIPDNADPYILMKSKYGFLHEKDHCVFTDFTDLKAGKLQGSLHTIFNALEDTRIERLGAREWKGQLSLARETLRELVKKEINSRFIDPYVPVLKKIVDLIYLRVKEHELGDLSLVVPDKIQRLFDEKVGDLLPAICKADTQEAVIKIAKTLHKRMKDLNPPQPQNQEGKPQKDGRDDSEQGDQSGSSDEEGDGQDSESSGGIDEDDNDQSDGDTSGNQSENQEADDDESGGTGSESDNDDDEEKDTGGIDSDDGDSDSGEGPDSDDSECEGSDTNDKSSEKGLKGSQNGSDDLEDERKELAEQVEEDKEESTINDDIAKDVENHANDNVIYRDANGLQEDIRRYRGDINTVKLCENCGRKMLGGNTSKFKRLFISMRAPKKTKLQRSGRLDLQRVWNDDTDIIFQRRQPGILEHSAVSMVIDNSSSMSGQRAAIASSLLSYMARELDRLRIPFECMGFTTAGSGSLMNPDGVRSQPILINLIKEFNEPYRKVRHHFDWPQGWTKGTVEFPCIRYAAQRLIHREETKKVLFILSDGESGCPGPMMEAMIEYIQRLVKTGISVVGIGIQNGAIANYVPDTIVIQDLNRVATEIFNKLSRILLKEGR